MSELEEGPPSESSSVSSTLKRTNAPEPATLRNNKIPCLAAPDAATVRSSREFGRDDKITSRSGANGKSIANLRPGEKIDSYVIKKFVGSGAMGSVYEASSSKFPNHRVALKVLSAKYYPSYHYLVEEAGQHARLSGHANVVQIIDIGEVAAGEAHAGLRYLVMEFVEGEPLDEYNLETLGSLVERLQWFEQVAQAIGHAHANQIVHRDLKPPNVMVTRAPVPRKAKVVDFGIAVAVSKSVGAPDETTDQHYVGGTRGYIRRGRLTTGRTKHAVGPVDDVYALAIILYQLLAGFEKHPYNLSESVDAQYVPLTEAAHVPEDLLAPLNALIKAATEGDTTTPPPADGEKFHDELSSILAAYHVRQRQAQHQEVADRAKKVERAQSLTNRRRLLALSSTLLVVVFLVAFFEMRIVQKKLDDEHQRRNDEHLSQANNLSERNASETSFSELLQSFRGREGDGSVARVLIPPLVRELVFQRSERRDCGPDETQEFLGTSPNGLFAIVRKNGRYILWDNINKREHGSPHHWNPFNSVSAADAQYFSADSQWFLGAEDAQEKRQACRWSTAQPTQPARCFGKLKLNIDHAALSRDGQTALFVAEGSAQVWNVMSKKLLLELSQDLHSVTIAVMSSDGQMVAAGNSIGQVLSWKRDGETYKKMQSKPVSVYKQPDTVRLLALSADGRWLAASYGGHTLWRLETHTDNPRVFPTDLNDFAAASAKPKIASLFFSDNQRGRYLLAGLKSGGGVVMWPMKTATMQLDLGTPVFLHEPKRSIDKLVMSADGELIFGLGISTPGLTVWTSDGVRLLQIGGPSVRWAGSVMWEQHSEVMLVLHFQSTPPQLRRLEQGIRLWAIDPEPSRAEMPAASCSLRTLAGLFAKSDPKQDFIEFTPSIQSCFKAALEFFCRRSSIAEKTHLCGPEN